ncbi:MAG TPA: hypothetical protein VJ728_09620 [Candidatus Binataceae bacterium]|nr:hypothetical protein [Candidatus Binataceae bacterium]
MASPPIVIGSNSSEERHLDNELQGPATEWIGLRGNDRLLLQTLRPSPDVRLIRRMLYYRNSDTPDPPERYPGQHPGVGYITTGYANLGAGSHTFDALFIIAPGTCDPLKLMREIGTSLVVKVHQIEPSH